jgi:ABC-type nitrate/sulfonate/bicarbonate transport system substrate-binding protein
MTDFAVNRAAQNIRPRQSSSGTNLLRCVLIVVALLGLLGTIASSAYELPTPEAEGILVSQDSPIHDIASLKGKKVAFNKGSDVHWLVLNVLQKAGLTYGDIQPVYLTPPDARAAFQRGAIDA